ncbi:hypothetical protein V5O48_000852 [Marasmius crinis-equi]|uniref:E3 ubiquitin-protein ligase CHFR cysteine rich domain-containing protein n=1 Tax=Marasmius crinis-equi TaxID=585013 RepID=A0ABR3G031_9AGAR
MAEQPISALIPLQNQRQHPTGMDSSPVTYQTQPTATAGVKRRASSSFEGMQDDSRKRAKDEQGSAEVVAQQIGASTTSSPTSTVDLVEDLYQELHRSWCLLASTSSVGVTSSLPRGVTIFVFPVPPSMGDTDTFPANPLSPKRTNANGTFLQNGGTNCPACRSESSIVSPSRPLQVVIDSLLRAAPHKTRSERERQQADEIYKGSVSMRIPTPREASPEPNLNISAEYARPCPHCSPNNPYRWTCPQPVPDPNTNIDHAWHLDDGVPPGHGHCGNCEVLLALQAPTTTKCDFCQTMFCGIAVPGRCVAAPLASQHLHGIADIGDIIQCQDVYECFNGNTVEVDFMLDHLTAQGLTPRHIYREIVDYIRTQPRLFAPLIEQDLFLDGSSEVDANPEAPRERTCRRCATEVFLWGLKEWWIRERRKGFVDERIALRKDCPEGSDCNRQKHLGNIITYSSAEP